MAKEKSLRVDRLKQRAKYCCCRYCGSELHVRQIVFHTQAMARIELYCDQCQKIEYGVEKEAYARLLWRRHSSTTSRIWKIMNSVCR